MRKLSSLNRSVWGKGTFSLRIASLPLVVLAVGLSATAWVAYQLASVAQERDRASFERHVQREQNAIISRMETYVALLRGTAGRLVSDEETTAAEFRRYVDRLLLRDRYPGLLGIGFSQRVPEGGEAALLEEMRAQGMVDFRVWPDSSEDERTAIVFLEPMDVRNRAAVGFDMYTEKARREAMQQARDQGMHAVASGKVTLVQEIDEEKQPGFLVYLPVFDGEQTATVEQRRKALRGFAYSPIRAWDFFGSVEAATRQQTIALTVYDGPEVDPERQLFRSKKSVSEGEAPRFSSVETIEIAGRPWTVVVESTPAFDASVQRGVIPLIVLAGALLTVVLTWLIWRDALSRVAASRAKRYAEATLRTSPVPLLVLESDLRVVTANEAFYAHFGADPSSTEGQFIYQLGEGEWDIPKLRALLEDILPRQASFEGFEVAHAFRNLGPRTLTLNARRMEVETDGPERIILVMEDITERKRSERELQQERDLLSVTLHSIGDAVITTDPAGRITNLNPVAESLTSWSNEEAAGQPLETVFRIVNEKSRLPVESPATKALRDGVIVGLANHTVLIAKDGAECPIDDSAAPIRGADGQIVGCVLVFRDVSERRRAEHRLQQSELRYRLVGDAANDAIWDWNLVTNEVTWNEGVRRLFAYAAEDVDSDSKWWVEHIHPEDRDRIVHSIHSVIDGAGELWTEEYRFLRKDGSYARVFDRGRVVRNEGGEPLRMVGSMLDLTERIEAEEKLRVQEAQYRSIFESTSDGILIFDLEGRLVEANPAACSMHGYAYEEFLGLPGTQLVHSDDHHKFADFVRQVLAGEPFNVDGTHLRKDGQKILVRVTGTSFVFGGRPALLAIVRDVTEEKRSAEALVESEQRLRVIMDSIPQKIFTALPDGNLNYLNPIWIEFTGLSVDSIEKWGWTQFIHPEDLDENLRIWRHSLETGEPYQFEHRFRRADGEYRWHITRALPVRDETGRISLWIGSNTEVHDIKSLQEELRSVAADLSEANRRKSEFLATLGHELRNPLAPIRTGLELMKSLADDPAELEETRSIMERQTQQLVRLIDDLLDVSRITQGKLQLRKSRIEIADVVRNAVETASTFIEEAGHELEVSLPATPIYLDADPNRLAQVFSNLLNNSTKYTPERGRIRISAQQEGSEVAVSVVDTGIGIPADSLSDIFEMFKQIDRPLEKGYKGLGIGLTLVKRLVEMHDGSIEVRSEGEGRGSEFIVRLPILSEESGSEGEGQPSDPLGEASGLRVLVVDDNEAAAKMLGMVIKSLGNEVRTAFDGVQGIAEAKAFRPDLVLMDIGMPRMNGYEAALALRKQDWGKEMTLVALTGWGLEEDRRRTKEAGFDDHLVKPVEPAVLHRLLAKLKTEKGLRP